MEVVHISAECYPVAKAGGLGDVVGALPKYQNKAGIIAKVVMPMYRTPFLYSSSWVVDYKAKAFMGCVSNCSSALDVTLEPPTISSALSRLPCRPYSFYDAALL